MQLLKVLSVIFILATTTAISALANPVRFSGRVVKISDGDTIHVSPNSLRGRGGAVKIRMITMDTPELHLVTPSGKVVSQGYWGEEADRELKRMIRVGDVVEVADYGKDAYGRVLGRVFKNRLDINLGMILSGWGSLYIICDSESCDSNPVYAAACREAQSKGRGIFNAQKPLPELPFVFRAKHQKRTLARPVGNRLTKTYYSPTDFERVPTCERVFFPNEGEARRFGFQPAKKN